MNTKDLNRFKQLYKFILPYREMLGISMIFHVLCTCLGLLMPLLLKIIIDKALGGSDLRLLFVLLGAMLILQWVRVLFFYVCNYLTHYPIQRMLFDLRVKLFKHLQSLSLRFYQEYRTGKLISNILTDVTALQSMLTTVIVAIASTVFQLVFVTLMLILLSPTLALICLFILPLVYFVFSGFRQMLKNRSAVLREHMSEVSANLSEVINGIKVVKSFGKERAENRNFMERLKPTFDMSVSLSMRSVMLNVVMDQIHVYTTLTVLGVGGYLVSQGHLSIGDLVAFYGYIGMFFSPVMGLTNLVPAISEGSVSADRLMKLMETMPEVQETENPVRVGRIQGKVSFDNVCFHYQPSRLILKSFSLNLEPGLKVALVGPSGSGKSTIASLLMRFYDVTNGSIRLDGVDIRDISLKELHQNVGIVLQESFLFSGTIEENIRYGKKNTSFEEIVEATKKANAYEFIRELPDGFRSQVGENGVSLSGGQKQRIAIARTILHNPSVLILDEATSALDTISEAVVQQALDKLMVGRTTFIIAHRLSTVRNADLIVVLKDGEIVQTGQHEQLLCQDGPYRTLYAMQLKEKNDPNEGQNYQKGRFSTIVED